MAVGSSSNNQSFSLSPSQDAAADFHNQTHGNPFCVHGKYKPPPQCSFVRGVSLWNVKLKNTQLWERGTLRLYIDFYFLFYLIKLLCNKIIESIYTNCKEQYNVIYPEMHVLKPQ